MRFKEICEAPIADIQTYGDMAKPGSLRPDDRGIVSSAKARDKIQRVLQKSPVDIALHFVNLDSPIEIEKHVMDKDSVGLFDADKFKARYGLDLRIVPNAINAVFVENEGEKRLPFTPWMVAHRLSHVVNEASQSQIIMRMAYEFREILAKIGKNYSAGRFSFAHAEPADFVRVLGTTKATREDNLNHFGEWWPEMFAQFCVTGTVRFNPLPAQIDTLQGTLKFVGKDRHREDAKLQAFAQRVMAAITNVLHELVGKIVVL